MTKFFVTLLTLISFVTYAQTPETEEDFISAFVTGQYVLIGQGIDTDTTYSGHVSIYLEDKQLKIKRVIDGKLIIGTAAFESALNGDAKVLRIRFLDNSKSYEETCLWASDLDNYARISCYLYIPGKDIKKPGFEALFIDHSLL